MNQDALLRERTERSVLGPLDFNSFDEYGLQKIAQFLVSEEEIEFGEVMGVSKNGHRLAAALKRYRNGTSRTLLIVFDAVQSVECLREAREELQRKFCNGEKWKFYAVTIFGPRDGDYEDWMHAVCLIPHEWL